MGRFEEIKEEFERERDEVDGEIRRKKRLQKNNPITNAIKWFGVFSAFALAPKLFNK